MEASESQRVVYIITYSRADTEKFRRETFGEAIIDNTNMMDIRWSFFRFWKPISQSEQREIAPCGHCFARFILENSSNVYIAD